MDRTTSVILVIACAVLGTTAVGLGGYWYGDAIVRLDPGDPANFDTPSEANDRATQQEMHDERADRVQLGFVTLTVGAGLLALATVLAAFAPPKHHIHRERSPPAAR